jgi:hypothetical protein
MNLRNFFSKLKRRNVAIAVVAWLDDRAHELACSLVRHDDKNSKKLCDIWVSQRDIRTKKAARFRERCGSYW